jgi:hypothetical protein
MRMGIDMNSIIQKNISIFLVAVAFLVPVKFAEANTINAAQILSSLLEMEAGEKKIQEGCARLTTQLQGIVPPEPIPPGLMQAESDCKNNCLKTATDKRAETEAKAKAALQSFNSQTAGCKAAAQSLLAAIQNGTQQQAALATQQLNQKSAECNTAIAAAMKPAIDAGSQCNTELQDNCTNPTYDFGHKDLQANCRQVAQSAQKAATESGMNAGSMLDNALKATQIASMLGQMMQGQQKPGSGVSGSAGSTGPVTPQKVDLGGGKSGLSSNTPGFGLAGADGKSKAGAGGANGAEGFTPFTMPEDFKYQPPGGSAGAGESGITAVAGPGGSGSGSAGGGGGSSSTGASIMPVGDKDKEKAAEDVGAFEFPTGGGGRGSGFLGLKSKGDELGELAPLGADAPPLGDFSALDDRGLASVEGAQGALEGVHDDGTSLFNVVGNKLKEIKKRGNI